MKLIAYIADELNNSLPAHYRATMQERVAISDLERPDATARYPDVSVLELPVSRDQGGVAMAVHSSHLLVTSPQFLAYPNKPLTQYSVEILDTRPGEKVVTAIEIRSPENKRPGDGCIAAISRRPPRSMRSICATACRWWPSPSAGDPDVLLDLQPLLNRVSQNRRVPIDYSAPCDPPLQGLDLQAASSLLNR